MIFWTCHSKKPPILLFKDSVMEKQKLEMEDMTLLNPSSDFMVVPINPLHYLFNREIELLVHEIRGVPGDIVELGVNTGNNATQFMWSIPEKKYFGFDTFSGYTKKDIEVDPNKESLMSNMKDNRWRHAKEKNRTKNGGP